LTGFSQKNPENGRKEPRADALCSPGSEGETQAGSIHPAAGGARGIQLRRSDKELIALCPFHKDTNPSLNIDPVQNVWHCKGACNEGGDVIEWVKRAEAVSFNHAVEMLKARLLSNVEELVLVRLVDGSTCCRANVNRRLVLLQRQLAEAEA
jgi:hypothetical protein